MYSIYDSVTYTYAPLDICERDEASIGLPMMPSFMLLIAISIRHFDLHRDNGVHALW